MELYNIYHSMEDTGLAAYSPYANKTVDQYMDEALPVITWRNPGNYGKRHSGMEVQGSRRREISPGSGWLISIISTGSEMG